MKVNNDLAAYDSSPYTKALQMQHQESKILTPGLRNIVEDAPKQLPNSAASANANVVFQTIGQNLDIKI